jgi:hypothetical protein
MEGDLKRNETVSPMAGKTPSQEMLVDVTRLEREYFERLPWRIIDQAAIGVWKRPRQCSC